MTDAPDPFETLARRLVADMPLDPVKQHQFIWGFLQGFWMRAGQTAAKVCDPENGACVMERFERGPSDD